MSQYYQRPVAFRVAAVFSDRMVLQRGKNIHVFGQALSGTQVTVTLQTPEGTCRVRTVAEDGKWLAVLPPQKACVDCAVTVESDGGERRVFRDVAIGEVWLAGGQSNMELELQNCQGGREELARPNCPNVRFYYTQKEPYFTREFFEKEDASGWQTFGPESARAWSAVGYFFAEKLSRDLGVTVGVIGCNWGGTSASAWMSREALAEDRELASYLEDYEAACAGISVEDQERAYDEYLAYHTEWDRKCGQMYLDNPDTQWCDVEAALGKCQWPGPMNCKNPFRPAGLYETMLSRVCPYSLAGFLFYQGESDDHKPRLYYKLLTRMIRQWREDFLDLRLPLLMVQLTMHRYSQDPDFGNWPLIREAQMDACDTVRNTGLAVIIDRGEFNNIHPLDKRTVGFRLELQALAQVYGEMTPEEACGPVYDGLEYGDGCILVRFRWGAGGLRTPEGQMPVGFEIAGRDRRYVPARAVIAGSKVRLSSPEITQPVYARYLWTNYGAVNLFGENGIPAAPFRTHRTDGSSAHLSHAQVQQIMET